VPACGDISLARLRDNKDDGKGAARPRSKLEDVGGRIRPGCWHVLTYLGIEDENDGWKPIIVAEFSRQMAGLAKYRDAGAVEIVTFKEGADRLGHAK
jgi:hypothetical protein